MCEDEMDKRFARIEEYLSNREAKKAEVIIARMLQSEHSHVEQAQILIYRARAKLFTVRPESAIDDLLKARNLAPDLFDQPATLELLADCYFARFELSTVGFTDRNDAHQAETIYLSIAESFPHYPNVGWVYYQMGRVLLTDNRVEQAMNRFQESLLKPSNVPELTAYCYERLGFIAYYEQRDYQQALNFLGKAVDTYPLKSDRVWLLQVHILRSRVLRDVGDRLRAIEAAERALKIASSAARAEARFGMPEALLTVGELLSGISGREAEVIGYLEQFLQISRKPLGVDVTWARVQEMLGDAYLSTGQFEKAVTAYLAVLRYNPYHPWEVSVYYRIGRALYLKGDYERSVAALDQAIQAAQDEGQPVDHQLYDIYGSAHFALGRYERAVEAYEKALIHMPRNDGSRDKVEKYYNYALDLLHKTL
jgi:tetratricopeptide (TPR) repeat protein